MDMTFEEADAILKDATKETYCIEQTYYRHRHADGDNTPTRFSICIHGQAHKEHNCERVEGRTLALAMAAALDYLQPVTVEQEDDGEIEAAPLVTTLGSTCDEDTAFIASTCGLEPADDLQDWANECREAVTL